MERKHDPGRVNAPFQVLGPRNSNLIAAKTHLEAQPVCTTMICSFGAPLQGSLHDWLCSVTGGSSPENASGYSYSTLCGYSQQSQERGVITMEMSKSQLSLIIR